MNNRSLKDIFINNVYYLCCVVMYPLICKLPSAIPLIGALFVDWVEHKKVLSCKEFQNLIGVLFMYHFVMSLIIIAFVIRLS